MFLKRLKKFEISPFDNSKLDSEILKKSSKNVPDLFVDDNEIITQKQTDFYNEILFPNFDDLDDFGSLIDKGQKNFFSKCLDKEIPMMSKILEVGCGTGQLSLYLSRFKREIFGIDLSKNSLNLGEEFRLKCGIQNVFFCRMNIFNLLFKKNFFDIIISNGVLHHTHSPKLAFKKIVKLLKKNGIIIVGLYHKYGRFFTKIKQKLAPFLGKKILTFDKRLKLIKSNKKKEAWKMDQFFNPYETTHTFSEVKEWFYEEKIEILNCIPIFNNENENIFEKKRFPNKLEVFTSEISQIFSSTQINEGGFFIIIGKKR